MNPLGLLVAERDCLRLMSDYCRHLDSRDEDAFVRLFTETAVFTKATAPTYEDHGHDAIRARLRMRPPSILSRHLMLNHIIDVDGPSSARGVAVGLVVRGNRDREDWPMPLRGVELVMEYRMVFARGNGCWRIARCDTQRLMDVEAVPR
jgi:hypothetical protein